MPDSSNELVFPSSQTGKTASPFRLHIGGKERKDGWQILNIQPGPNVDFVGDIRDLSGFADESCTEIYCSHVLEHLTPQELLPTLKDLRRILSSGGRLYISVPDLDVLCHLLLSPRLDVNLRYRVMRMIFGGQTDEFDLHKIGLNLAFLSGFLEEAGFSSMEQVEYFGLFEDSSSLSMCETPISLNVIAEK